MADNVLHHHDGAVDHHPEVQRTEGEKIRGNMLQVKADRCEQQRERDGERNNQRAANVPEEEKENDDDEDDSLCQVVQDRVGGEVHQVAAVDEGNQLHALRKNMIVQLLNLFVDAFQYRLSIGSLLQQRNAFRHVVIV